MMMIVVYYMKCALVEALRIIVMYALEVYYIMMVVVYYMKWALVEAFSFTVMYDNLVIVDENAGSILHEVGISRGLKYYSNV